MRIFYGAGHEQFKPSELLRHAQLAEGVGFDGIACSDRVPRPRVPRLRLRRVAQREPLGLDWPSGAEQLELMDEALDMIRRLWNGETIANGSKYFKTKDAKLHTRPPQSPPVYVSAF